MRSEKTIIYISSFLLIIAAAFMATGCAGRTGQAGAGAKAGITASNPAETPHQEGQQLLRDKYAKLSSPYKPAITWRPSFSLKEIPIQDENNRLPDLKVGAEINTRGGKVPLYEVIKALADLKDMNVSWASDVDQSVPVSVKVKPETSFWEALEEILRQADYFYEFKNGTIVVKYKDTKKFSIINPFVTANYRTSVGGDFLGASTSELDTGMRGELSVEHSDEEIDLWTNIEENLARILDLGTVNVPEANTELSEQELARIREACRRRFPSNPNRQDLCFQQERDRRLEQLQSDQNQEENVIAQGTGAGERNGFFFTIDKPLGIVTVTAPRSMLEKVENYIDNINRELSRQVIIEAKIVEVQLDDITSTGIDWSGLLKDRRFDFHAEFGGDGGQIYPTDGIKLLRSVTMAPIDFSLVLNFLNEYGNVNILSNPKLSLLNGQPAMITGGVTERIISEVTTVVDNSGGASSTSYTVETQDILTGVGLGVIANIADNDEIVLQLTPVNTNLVALRNANFAGVELNLPTIQLREMTTMARVKSGQMLVIGGIILEKRGNEGNKVPILGDVPFIGKYLFSSNTDTVQKRELVILLRPQIVEL